MYKGIVATDVDGTLLPNGQADLDPKLFPIIRQILQDGFAFCAASGRDYASLQSLFAPVKEDIYFITTNGGQLIYHDQILLENNLTLEEAHSLSEYLYLSLGVDSIISTSHHSYMKPHNEELVQLIRKFGNHVQIIDDFAQIDEPMIKVSAYCPPMAAGEKYALVADSWKKEFKVAVAGPAWVDFTRSDKGGTLAELADRLSVAPADIYAFGDQQNDFTMLELAGHPYLKSSSHEETRSPGFPETDDVIRTLQELFSGKASQ